MSGEDEGYEIVLPFVVVASQGGRFDDASFVAGFHTGQVMAMAGALASLEGSPVGSIEATVPAELLHQLDLVAMHHGLEYSWRRCSDAPEWAHIEMRRREPGEHLDALEEALEGEQAAPARPEQVLDLGPAQLVLGDDATLRLRHLCSRRNIDGLERVVAPAIGAQHVVQGPWERLTLSPSVVCPDCGLHGWVRDGAWQPA